MKTLGKWLILGIMTVAVVGSAQAAEEGWQFKITPYLWALGIDGTVGKGPVTVPVDLDFVDAIENLEFGGMLVMEANYAAWSLLADVDYLRLSQDKDTPLGKLDVTVEEWIVQGAALYAVAKSDSTILDAGLGVRYMSVDTKLKMPAGDNDFSEGWTDPLFVLRLRQQFSENVFGGLYGDIGGFGVASKLTSQVNATLGYAFNETVSLLGGYRYLDYDYTGDDGFKFDASESGFLLGLQFKL